MAHHPSVIQILSISVRCRSYDVGVFKSIFSIVTLAAALVGCHSVHSSDSCKPIHSATRVEVHGNGQQAVSVITDKDQIQPLVAFADARRQCSTPTTYTIPAPQENAIFYDHSDFVGSIGAGSNFFSVSCPHNRGIRDATPTELDEFKRLISPNPHGAKEMVGR
jgi:hypothetical protein